MNYNLHYNLHYFYYYYSYYLYHYYNNNYYYYKYYSVIIITIIIIIIIITIYLILLLLSLLIYLFIFYYYYYYYYYYYFFGIRRPIRPEGTPFGRFYILGCCELKEVVSTQTYLYNPSIQPSRECLVINWMVNSCYGPYQL